MSFLSKLLSTIFPIPKDAGKRGEQKVSRKLNPLIFNKVNHRYLENIFLEDEYGRTHEIDHIEIRQNGIFCIETKNLSGYIVGKENTKYWTQYLGLTSHTFLNPLIQNDSHVFQLKKILNNKYNIYSIVAFCKNNAPAINVPNVLNVNKLQNYLLNFPNYTHFTDEEMDEIYSTIFNHKVDISNKEHIKNIENYKRTLEDAPQCPLCSGKLIKRKGSYGEFYGCSNYPKCKYTRNIP